MRLPFSRIHWTYFPNFKKIITFFPHKIPDLSDTQKDERKHTSEHREHHLFISQLPAYIPNSECHKRSIFKKQQNLKNPPDQMLCIHFAHNKRWCLLNSVALLRPVGAPAKAYSSAVSEMSQKRLPVSIKEHSSNNYSTQLKLFKTKQLSVPTQDANKATTKKICAA